MTEYTNMITEIQLYDITNITDVTIYSSCETRFMNKIHDELLK
jgi:hypothetical protein